MQKTQRKLPVFLLLIAACGSGSPSGVDVSESKMCSPPGIPGALDVEVEGVSLSNPPPDMTVPIQIYFSSQQAGNQFGVQIDATDVPVGVYGIKIIWNFSVVGGGTPGPFAPSPNQILESGTLTVTKDAGGSFSYVLEWDENPLGEVV